MPRSTKAATAAKRAQHKPAYEKWARRLWELHAEKGEVTTKDYRDICHRPFAQAKIRFETHDIEYPVPVQARGIHAEIRAKQHAKIVALYERLGRPLTVLEIGSELGCAHKQDARRRLSILHARDFELPPIANWQPKQVVAIDAEDEEIEARRWQVKGEPIKTIRIAGLLGTPADKQGNQTWYNLL